MSSLGQSLTLLCDQPFGASWFLQTAKEAENWQAEADLSEETRFITSRAVDVIRAVADLEAALFNALEPQNTDVLSLVGIAAESAMTVGLALQNLIGGAATAALQAELARRKSGLSKGNAEKAARKDRWQARVRRWCSDPQRDWKASNAALATAFRAAQPSIGAPNSAELDKFIGRLRPPRG